MARFPVAFGLTLGLLVAANVLANRVVPGADVLVGLALVAGLAVVAWGSGLTTDDVGLARRTWGSGLRWGGAAAAIVAVGYGIAASIPAVRDAVAASSASWGATVVNALVVIPLATVIPEEFAFRGVLWGSLRRESGQRAATVVSSALFGVWHVLQRWPAVPRTRRSRGCWGPARRDGPCCWWSAPCCSPASPGCSSANFADAAAACSRRYCCTGRSTDSASCCW